MQRYNKYKDSGISWLGEIPEHWECKRIKYLFKEINERSLDGGEDLLSISQYTGVTKKSDKIENGDLLTTASTLEGYKIVRKRQLVTNIMLAWNGSLGFSEFNGITSPAYCIYELSTNDYYKYFHYLFKTDVYKSEFKRNSSGVIESRLRLYTDDFFNIWSVLPPLHEQEAIAAFLDEKCEKIDAIVSIKEQQIEKLKELRQITIHNAVTKGINPNTEMKDSGIEWIGEIPKHWKMKRLKYLFNIVGGGTPSKEKLIFWDGDLPWVSPKDMKLLHIDTTEDYITEEALKYSSTKLIKKGSLLIVVRSGILQRTIPLAFAGRDMTINQDLKAFIQTSDLSENFLYYFIKGCENFLLNEWVKEGATVESIEMSLMLDNLTLVPPFSEQQEIVTYLEERTSKIDQAISQKQEQITKLKEYKQSLINEVVTGKVRINDKQLMATDKQN